MFSAGCVEDFNVQALLCEVSALLGYVGGDEWQVCLGFEAGHEHYPIAGFVHFVAVATCNGRSGKQQGEEEEGDGV